MKKILIGLFAILCFFSCKEESEVALNQLSVQLTSETSINDYSNFEVSVVDLKSGENFRQETDSQGRIVFTLPYGSYNLTAEKLEDEVSTFYGSITNFVFTQNTELKLSVSPSVLNLDKSFVLDELYFNGNSNGDYDYTYYEQYFTIRNISDKALYADGLSFGITGDFNTLEEINDMNKLLPGTVVLSQFYTIPGNGKTHKVNPGESLVIAMSAINHKEGGNKPNSLDLSGADFEIYVEGAMTPDNPDVENVIVNFSTYQAFHWQYSGATPMILFKLKEDANEFIKKNKAKFANPNSMGTMIQDYIKLPSEYILDGVETGVIDNFYHKTLPETIDREAILIPGTGMPGDGFKGHFIQRKRTASDKGYETVQDTNNSKNDFELITGGAKNYPKK